jgi:GT2 family glycosyltransferase
MTMLVSIVLINFNGLRDLPDCLDSIKRQDYENVEFIAVDNLSTDGSRELLLEFASDPENAGRFSAGSPRVIANTGNMGFSSALNGGIREAAGDLIVSLNTDIVLEPSYVSEMASVFGDPEVGSAAGKLLRFPPGGDDNSIDSAGHVVFRNRLAENRGEGEPGATAFNEPARVFGTCGAAAMYSRRMLEDIKVGSEYFDESFFAFWEDLDVDWRAALRGWKCMYNPRAVGYHRRGGAGYRKSLIVEYHNYKNRYLLIIKNDSARYLLRNLPGWLLTEALKAGALLVRCPRALVSLVEVARLLPATIAKRRIIQSRRIVPSREIEAWFEPFNYRKWIGRHLFGRSEMIDLAEMERR